MKDLKEHPTKVPVLRLKRNTNQDNATINLRLAKVRLIWNGAIGSDPCKL